MQFKEAGAIVAIGMSLHLQPPGSNSGVDKVKRGTGGVKPWSLGDSFQSVDNVAWFWLSR
jgi:hypothetical protein